nr:NERD domain-containing protein [Yersinia pseudotuberculosis]
MTHGERRVAQRLESHLGEGCLVWYDIPVGRQYRHPDFVIIDPSIGLIFLEVKDWRLSTLRHADPQTVTLDTEQGQKQERNPLVQVREYACATIEMLSQDSGLQQKTGLYKGKLNIAWAYGVVFTNITRQQLKEKYALTGRWGDIAVLCPTQFSADRLTELLVLQDIPTVISFTPAEKKCYSHREDVVHLLTFQSSKGLEFPFVAVINASFVHKAAEDESEAIPALYVAFTRATRSLLVTCYRENSISRHLAEFAGMDLQELQIEQP